MTDQPEITPPEQDLEDDVLSDEELAANSAQDAEPVEENGS